MAYFLGNLHWFLLLVSCIVVFHEAGHFVVAKAFGVRVLRFSVGVGPKLFSFTRAGTEYQFCLLPFGGFVNMLGYTPGEEVDPSDSEASFLQLVAWKRALIIAAGPLANFLLALVIYFSAFVGEHNFLSTKLGYINSRGAAAAAGLQPGDIILAFDNQPVARWDELAARVAQVPGKDVTLAYQRGDEQGVAHLQVGVLPTGKHEGRHKRGYLGISPRYLKPWVAVIDPQSPAATAGVATGDEILAVGDRPIAAWHELRNALAQWPSDAPLRLTLRRPPAPDAEAGSEPEQLVVQIYPGPHPPSLNQQLFSSADTPGGYTGLVAQAGILKKVQPNSAAAKAGLRAADRIIRVSHRSGEEPWQAVNIGILPFDLASAVPDPQGEVIFHVQRGRALQQILIPLRSDEPFGITYETRAEGEYEVVLRTPPLEALQLAAKQVYSTMAAVSEGLWDMARGALSIRELGGPIMLFQVAEAKAKEGLARFIKVIGSISVNIGIINLLPLPGLDGGHLVLLSLEGLTRRRMSIAALQWVGVVSFIFIVGLMLLVMRNDILRILGQ